MEEESERSEVRGQRSVDQGQEAQPRPSLIFAVLVAEFLDEKFFFGTNPRDDDGHTSPRLRADR